jgi:hypothetical protein
VTDDRAAELAAALARLPDESDVSRYDEPKQGLIEIMRRIRTAPDSATDLAEAARARPDAFDDEVLSYVIPAARIHAISEPMCATLEAVVRHRGAVPAVLEGQLTEILEEGQLDAAARLATTCAELGSANRDSVITRLARYIYEHDSFLSFAARPDWLTPLLHRLADLNAQLLAHLVADRLRDRDASARHGAASFASELAIAHPEVAPHLRPAVLESLELEGFLFRSGTGSAVDALAAMYIEDPAQTDTAIDTFRSRASDHAKKTVLRVYERVLYLATPHPTMGEFLQSVSHGSLPEAVFAPDAITGRVLDRLLDLMETEPALDTWDPAAGALEYAGGAASTAALRSRLDRLVFALLEAARLWKQPRPTIELAGFPRKPDGLIALEKMAADTEWSGVFSGIARAIAGAARDGDDAVVDGVIGSIERLKTLDADGWIRSELVKVLRVLITTPAGRARLMPLLHKYLFDAAVPVQIAALGLCETLVEKHQDELPQLLLDAVSALILSPYVYVGRAAVPVAEHITARIPEFRTELISNLLARARAEGTDWRPRLNAIAAAVRVADDDADLGARILATYGIPFFTEAPSLYARGEFHWVRRWNPPPRYQLAYAVCVLRHLERATKPGDEYAAGNADDEIADLRRMDRELLGQLADQIVRAAEGLAGRDPATAFDLTAVLTDAGRPDLASRACTAIVTQKREDRSSQFFARLAEAARPYYDAEVALEGGDLSRATELFRISARTFEAIREY